MGKDKLRRFAENETFDCMVQPEFEDVFAKEFYLKGKWREEFFHNSNPIIVELGCGKGEYTIALAEKNPNCNYIGIDIKGARMWRGAKTATERQMKNVCFIRTRIEFITSIFATNEIDQIWITFPDPQLKSKRVNKRLTSPLFLERYSKFLKNDGAINLKTDSQHLFNYTNAIIGHFGLIREVANKDIYGSGYADAVLSVKTAYECEYLKRGLPITYICFKLVQGVHFEPFEWEGDKIDKKDNEVERL